MGLDGGVLFLQSLSPQDRAIYKELSSSVRLFIPQANVEQPLDVDPHELLIVSLPETSQQH